MKVFITTLLILTTPNMSLAAVTTITGVPATWEALVGWIIQNVMLVGTALAILMLVIGGAQILLYGGSERAQSGAKERMWGAFIGLAILWLSYAALSTINPTLVNFSF